ncbi:MAG TPA: CoA transferase [Acidimicrobiia bacterium]|nr:CoA transferase [Acidimicrobiia bacterium]
MSASLLSGVTILELGQVIAGTYGGTILADMGAEVIKIEPFTGDAARNATIAPLHGESSIHLFMNRGKKSVVLDLKSVEGLEIFYSLVEQADVVIDNFRPGVMARLGIDHEALKKRKPPIITVSVTGFGETGPERDRPAFDLVIQAFSGHVDITGHPDAPPARVGVPIADLAGGIFTCISVLGALVGRGLHGDGHHADVAMLDSLVSMLTYDAVGFLNGSSEVSRQGTAHAHMVPWQAFEVKDGYVVVAVRDEKFWRNLCDAVGRPDLKNDPRTIDNSARVANRQFLVELLDEVFITRTKDGWMAILDEFDIPAAPVNDFAGIFSDPQVEARQMVKTYEHPTLGAIRYSPSPMKFSDWEFPNRPAPMLGEHTREVLSDRLGFSSEDIDRLTAGGVVKTWPETDPG